MWALIAFIVLGVSIAALIEINERVKRSKAEGQKTPAEPLKEEDCTQPNDASSEACADCALIEVCEKEEKKKTGR